MSQFEGFLTRPPSIFAKNVIKMGVGARQKYK
jgi:hypothetical protein